MALIAFACLCPSAFSQTVPFAFWKSASAASTTNPVPGYAYWWNPDAGLGTSRGNVTSWTDRSASALVLMPPGAGPASGTFLNGHQVLEFSDAGSGNVLTNINATLASPWELVAVIQAGSDVLNGNPFAIESDNSTARGAFISAAQWELGWFGVTYAGAPVVGDWYVIDCVFESIGTSAFYVNGSAVMTQSASSISVTGINVGGANPPNYPWSGAIGDVIIYTTPVTSAQRAQNTATLRAKYGF